MKALNEKMRNAAMANEIATGNMRNTPLERKAHLEKLQLVEGKEIFAVQYTSIHKAAIDGSVDAMKHFLTGRGRKKGGTGSKVSCDDWDQCKMSPIHYAAERGYDHVMEAIVDRGGDVNCKNGNGCTAMMLCAKFGHHESVDKLYVMGGNLLAKSSGGMSIAHYAIQCDYVECLKVLVKRFTEVLQLAMARVEELELIALNGGDTAIGDIEDEIDKPVGTLNVEYFREALGLDENVTEEDVLAEALKMQPEDILDLPSLSGLRCAHMCGDFGSMKCLEYLISLGVSMSNADSVGETPLHKAGRKNFFEAYDVIKTATGPDGERVQNLLRETPHGLLHDETLY